MFYVCLLGVAGERHVVEILACLAGTIAHGVFVVDGEVTDIAAGELVTEVVNFENSVDDDGVDEMETENEG